MHADLRHANLSGTKISEAQRIELNRAPSTQDQPTSGGDREDEPGPPTPQKRLLSMTLLLASLGAWMALAGIAASVAIGGFSLFIVLREQSLAAVSHSSFLWPIGLTALGILTLSAAAFARRHIAAEGNGIRPDAR